ncbi:hypothetical protein K461DRAFT_294366 [Myriangium duriaei CBS 260.36]|uniref:ferric-chelate reductase (NADPH) n=1 Tax=Myriangium duriaei CBS 260.36 TaxID=1168546 RepID=A0A9P4IZG7_9PEZI|nr:hypothetical protein K461DRAFT_294366 [Myriangium duriaei CBS 260.36]
MNPAITVPPFVGSPTENLTLTNPLCNSDKCKEFYEAHQLSQKLVSYYHQYDYGHYVSYYMLAVLGIFTVRHVWNRWHDYRFDKREHVNAVRSRLQIVKDQVVALIRAVTYRRAPDWLSTAFGNPSFGVLGLLLLFILYCCVLAFTVRPYYRQHRGYGSPPLAVRTGLMATALLPWIIGLSGKANIITLLTGVGHEKLNIVHRWISWLCVGLSVVHTVPFIVAPLKDGGPAALHKQYYKLGGFEYTGTPPLAMLFGLLLLSLPWVRRRAYEGFYHVHFWLAVTFVGLMFWHCGQEGDSWIYMWVTISVWLTSISMRAFWFSRAANVMSTPWISGSPIAVTILSDNMTHLRLLAPLNFRWKPGQHIYLRIPKLNFFDNHPFTVANACRSGLKGVEVPEISLLVRSQAGFTRKLSTYLTTHPDAQLEGWIEGPYGGHGQDIGLTYDSVVLVAGGGGISAVLPCLEDLAFRMNETRQLRTTTVWLFWSVRRAESIQWIKDALGALNLRSFEQRLKVFVHVTTQGSKFTISSNQDEKSLGTSMVSEEDLSSIADESLNFRHGRIDFTKIFEHVDPASRCIVIGCGPENFKVDLANACAAAQRKVLRGQLSEIALRNEIFDCACLHCRTAKVRCIISGQAKVCDRCLTNKSVCRFTPPKRSRRNRAQRKQSDRNADTGETSIPLPPTPSLIPLPSAQESGDTTASSLSGVAPITNKFATQQTRDFSQAPVITPEIKAKIFAALATLTGKRGSPFSFVTSGDAPTFITNGKAEHRRDQHGRAKEPTLKISVLLRPLTAVPGSSRAVATGEWSPDPKESRMPSYLSSMSLGENVTDPINSGILTSTASAALWRHFMLEMNAKWEFVLDPTYDTHDDVRHRSPFLYTTVLFCSSKFDQHENGELVQTRLCSIARNMAIRQFAEGNRSIETMQSYYLLACWKELDDDVSYLHSGYAFRVLQDCDAYRHRTDDVSSARYHRTWLALYRQNKQQSLFFMRSACSTNVEAEVRPPGYSHTLDTSQNLLPLDAIAICSADLRQIQAKLRSMVETASLLMLSSLEDLLNSELQRWRSSWLDRLTNLDHRNTDESISTDHKLRYPGDGHVRRLMSLGEHSVRLNVASAILRKALLNSSPASEVQSDQRYQLREGTVPAMMESSFLSDVISTQVSGLKDSVEGALGTLSDLLAFPIEDLRRCPDSFVLLAPSAALFLCLLLCFPTKGLLGYSFQRTAVDLLENIAGHMSQGVQSRNETVALCATYLRSLVRLITPNTSRIDVMTALTNTGALAGPSQDGYDTMWDTEILEDGIMKSSNNNLVQDDAFLTTLADDEQSIDMLNLEQLLDPDFFWGSFPVTSSTKP